MTTTANSPVFGWQAALTIGGVEMKHASGISVTNTMSTEEVDIMAAENNTLYVPNKKEMSISFTLKMFNMNGTSSSELSVLTTALAAGTPVQATIDSVTGYYIVTKCDANRDAGKVVSYSVELKPTISTSTSSSSGTSTT